VRRFNTPPEWPDPPTARWRPPRRWRPAASWPPAPAGWAFWVDQHGNPVRGPIGRYGGPTRLKAGATVLVPVTITALAIANPLHWGESVSSAPALSPATTAATAPATEIPIQGTQTPTRLAIQTPTSPETPAPSTPATRTPSPSPPSTSTPAVPISATTTSVPASTTTATPRTPTVVPTSPTTTTAAVVYTDCAEVRAVGKAPLHRGDPGYSQALDHNGDGVACDRGNS
jgi:hypothetical protein